MKKVLLLFSLLNFSFFALAQNPLNKSLKYLKEAPENSIADAILFSIEEDAYSLIDLKKYMFLSGIKNPKKACINYIQALLIEKKAKSLGANVPKKVIDQAINEILKRNNMNLSTLKILLESKGISFEEFEKFVENQILVSSYIQSFEKPNILTLAQEFNLEIYEPLCYIEELKEFFVPNFYENLKIEKEKFLENRENVTTKGNNTKTNGNIEIKNNNITSVMNQTNKDKNLNNSNFNDTKNDIQKENINENNENKEK